MPSVSLDAMFGDGGADLGGDVVAKAQVRFRVRPPAHPAAQDVVDRVVSAYDERLDMILDEIVAVIRCANSERPPTPVLVVEGDRSTPRDLVAKATPRAPFRPGSRGGKWYRDSKGNVRYGEPPEGRFMGNAGTDAPMPHLDHFRPRQFMGTFGSDRELTGFLVEHGSKHGFSDSELRFLSAWYGTSDGDGGALYDAFLECAGLTREEAANDVTNLRFGSKQLTYEEAVFEFFAAQGALFMGEEPTSPDQVKEWHAVLNDEIKPLLDDVFVKYEGMKDDESLQEHFAGESGRQRRRFFDHARRCAGDVDGVSDSVVGDWDPTRVTDTVLMGMQALGLIARRARAEHHAYVHGRPHLRDAVVVDGRLIANGSDSPLLEGGGKLAELSSSQLMLLYVAAELHRRWDAHARSFSPEKQADVGAGELGEAVLSALAGKTPRWAEVSSVIRGRLAELVDLVVSRLNAVNSREGLPTKHGPAKRRRGSR